MHEPGASHTRRGARRFCQHCLESMNAVERIDWALEALPGAHIVSSSFGAQSAVMLHLMVSRKPDIPVVLVDTGYLFPETYRFIDGLREQLGLDLRVFRSEVSGAWQEARYGRRWEQGIEGIEEYNRENKIEPMERALDSLDAGTWFAGLRRSQSRTRNNTPLIETSGNRWKVHPIADWNDRDVHDYLTRHDLPYHPLREAGYVSIGDVHTTRAVQDVSSLEETRFFGLKRECGLHEMDFGKTA